jgi:predicted DNA-binding transcriptional regulator YafY
MARGDQALRQWKILTTIMSRPRYGVTQKKLLDEIEELVPRGKGKRTLQRDLQILDLAGFPIDRSGRTEDGQVLYKFRQISQSIPPIMPTVEELIALAVGRSLLTLFDGTPFKENLDSFWRKAHAIFPKEALEALDAAQTLFGTLDRPAMDFKQYKLLLKELSKAIKDRRQITMTYFSPRQSKVSHYTVDPIMIVTYNGCLYLAAYVYEYKENRTFHLDRIRKATQTGETFGRRTFSLEKLKNEAFGMMWEEPFDFVVRFDKKVAAYVKARVLHPSQKLEEQSDGSLILHIRAGGWGEMKSWVMSFSQFAEVLKPQRMREEIKKELEQTLEKYRKDDKRI